MYTRYWQNSNLSLYVAITEGDQAISGNTSFGVSVRFLLILACFQKGSKPECERDYLSIYAATEGSALPLLGECLTSVQREQTCSR